MFPFKIFYFSPATHPRESWTVFFRTWQSPYIRKRELALNLVSLARDSYVTG